ncbi:hypothetical protein PRUPE_1G077800 [Prunus persica]|uniref:Uncharacterized protein n=1 Tax=Prunus persica TaxID=3760 RepID=A0A251QTX0_PRUPE|nr:hypothetical protein PRUPE_1G077800 [Prunus persica]
MTILAQCQPSNQTNKKIAEFLEAICEVALRKLLKKSQSVSSSTHSPHRYLTQTGRRNIAQLHNANFKKLQSQCLAAHIQTR